jgi:hypothetical protein
MKVAHFDGLSGGAIDKRQTAGRLLRLAADYVKRVDEVSDNVVMPSQCAVHGK